MCSGKTIYYIKGTKKLNKKNVPCTIYVEHIDQKVSIHSK